MLSVIYDPRECPSLEAGQPCQRIFFVQLGLLVLGRGPLFVTRLLARGVRLGAVGARQRRRGDQEGGQEQRDFSERHELSSPDVIPRAWQRRHWGCSHPCKRRVATRRVMLQRVHIFYM